MEVSIYNTYQKLCCLDSWIARSLWQLGVPSSVPVGAFGTLAVPAASPGGLWIFDRPSLVPVSASGVVAVPPALSGAYGFLECFVASVSASGVLTVPEASLVTLGPSWLPGLYTLVLASASGVSVVLLASA